MNSDHAFLQRLRNKEGRAIYQLYRLYFPTIEKYISLNSGSKEDAEDIFQEAVLIFLSRVSNDGFLLTASIKTYIFSVCRNLWLKQLRQKSRHIIDDLDFQEPDFLTHSDEVEQSEQHWNSLPVVLRRISAHCSGLLKQLFLTRKIPPQYKNEHTLHNQKYKCLQQARKVVAKLSAVVG